MPKSVIGKLLAIVWFAAASGLLLFAYLQRDIHDMPEAFVWLMMVLTFPIGILAAIVVGVTWVPLSTALGVSYEPFRDLIPYWAVSTVAGYWQWFVLVPWLKRKVRNVQSRA